MSHRKAVALQLEAAQVAIFAAFDHPGTPRANTRGSQHTGDAYQRVVYNGRGEGAYTRATKNPRPVSARY